MRTRSYRELKRLGTFEERLEYLRLSGTVAEETFGRERWINQRFYTSPEWRNIRRVVIARDRGFDLGVDGYEVHGRVVIHHINPMLPENIHNFDEMILDPENLITASHETHNAIHFGGDGLMPQQVVERSPRDHILW